MKVILVTGTPGTGKTTLSTELAKKLNFQYIDVNEIVKKCKLSESYDRKRKTKVVDIKKLNRELIKEISTIKKYPIVNNFNKKISNSQNPLNKKNIKSLIKNNKTTKKGVIIDSHLSHYLPKKYVDLCIVTKCDLKELERRLKNKKYSKSKIRENLDAEIFDICLNEAKESKHKIFVINTTKGIKINSVLKKFE